MPEPLQLLIVDDNPADAELLVRTLRKSDFEPEWQRVDTEAGFNGALHAGLDVILCDYEMPHFSGLRALQLANERCPEVPLIVVSGAIGEETAVEAMRLGATDYLLKDRLGRLGPAVTQAMAARRLRREREQTEKARQLKLSELRVLFDLIPAMIWFKDTENRILRVNQRVADAAGLPVAEIEGKPSQEIYPQDAARFYADDLEVIRSGAPKLGFVETVRGPGGDELWVQTDKMPVCDQAGKVFGIVVVARDITERRRAEEAMRESEARFAGAFEHAPIGMALVSPEGRFLRVNQVLCDLIGYSEAELLSRTFEDITYPEDRELSAENLRRTIAGEVRSFQVEKRYVHAHGHLVTCLVNSSLVRDGHGQPRYFVSQIQDITKNKEAEETLRESERRYQTLAETSPAGVFRTDTQGQTTYVNARWCKMTGLSVEEALGDGWLRAIHPEDREALARGWREASAAQGVSEADYRLLRPDGSMIWVIGRAMPDQDAAGRLVGYVGTLTDITERKQTEAELEQTHNQLLAVSHQAGMAEFATGVLHNVGNVLNSVNVASTCMADSLKQSKSANLAKVVALMREHEADLGAFFTGDARGKLVPGYLAQLADHLAGEQATALKELGELQKNIEHIKSIIAVQQESAKSSHLPEACSLTDLVEDTLRVHANGLRRAGIQLIREFEDIPPIMAVKNMVLQILVNLVRNAIEACEAVGDRPRCLTIRTSRQAGRVRVAVADNGSGILPENLARIFAHGFTTKKDGHGFGLHSAELAAKEMGGSLIVESEGPWRGATFTLELPMESQPENSAGS